MHRREFAKLLAVTSGMSCLAGNLAESLAAAARIGKPLFSQVSLNAMLKSKNVKALAAEAKKDVKAFLLKHFYFNPQQMTGLNQLTDEDYEAIQTFIAKVEAGSPAVTQIKNSKELARQAIGKGLDGRKGTGHISIDESKVDPDKTGRLFPKVHLTLTVTAECPEGLK